MKQSVAARTQPKAGGKPTVQKQCLAIDVAKDELQICFREQMSDGQMRVRAQKKVSNNLAGWKNIQTTISKNLKPEAPLGFSVLMEATGVYHEKVCYYLHDAGNKVVVLLSNHVKAYARSLGTNSKNDKIDAQVMAQMGLERTHQAWSKPAGNIMTIRNLARERQGIIDERTATKNQHAAAIAAQECDKATEKRFKVRIKLFDTQIKEIEAELAANVAQDEALRDKVRRITTIPGFGVLSATLVLAETNAFADFHNKAQLTSYAGYDVVENQSGTINGKTHISKRGNSRLRLALYFPSISATKHCPPMKNLYNRIFDRTKIKMKGIVAVQRKMLLLAYTLCKTKTDFDPKFHQNHTTNDLKTIENSPQNAAINTTQKLHKKNVDTTPKGVPTLHKPNGLCLQQQR